MADANALVELIDVKSLLGISGDEDMRTELLISAASAAANLYTGRLLASRDHTEILDGNGHQSIMLSQYPVTEVDHVYIDSDRAYGAATEDTDFIYYEDTGELWRSGKWPEYRQNIKVDYTAGYTIAPGGTLPADIKMAVIEIVQWYRHRIEAEGIGLRAIQNPDGIVSQYEIDIPLSAKNRLAPYRKVR